MELTQPRYASPLVEVDRVRQLYPKGSGDDLLVLDDVGLHARATTRSSRCSAARAAASPRCCASSPA